MRLCVCLSASLSPELHVQSIGLYVLVRPTYGHGSALLWRRCDVLCTSGFMDGIKFSHSDQEYATRKGIYMYSVTQQRVARI